MTDEQQKRLGEISPRVRLTGNMSEIIAAIRAGVQEKGRALTGDEALALLLNLGLAEKKEIA